MVSKLVEIGVQTRQRAEMQDVTSQLQQVVKESKVEEGLLVATVMHTTAGITINENADPDVVHDMLKQLEKIAPEHNHYHHAEGNSDAHIKSSLMGSSLTIPVSRGRLVLGTWQGVYFCEFDGPRQRKLQARILS